RAKSDGAVAYQHSCHGLRGLGLAECADRLLEGAVRVEYDGTECCGFGGLFAVAMPEVSAAIMDARLDRLERAGAAARAGGDASCPLHLEGGRRLRGPAIEVRHIAELLPPDEDGRASPSPSSTVPAGTSGPRRRPPSIAPPDT